MSEDIKPDIGSITIVFKNGSGETLAFKVKRTTKFKKIMDVYATKQGIPVAALDLKFEGTTVKDEDTPELLDMEDNNVVDVMVKQAGGECA